SIVFEAGKELHMEIEPDLMYVGDEARLQQVAIILLDNALKHAPIETTIQIRLHQVGVNYELEVSNEGEGIPPQHLDKVFERFYRVDASRARDTGGYGLGLSIAKSIVEQHHGSISVKSQFNELTTFTVTLPIKQNHHLFKR
ncbi:MAG: ATP-binding protein, partial [Turicibacter sp.]|nr:ATP-binding protein [Turicibacter sp.]